MKRPAGRCRNDCNMVKLLSLGGLAWLIAFATQTASGLTGQVTSGGAPVSGVTVTAAVAGSAVPVATATSGVDGNYRLVPLPRGVYRVEFRREEYEPVIRWGIVVLPDAISELSTEMSRKGEVAVRIETSLGVIVIAVDTVRAPITAANFLKYVDGGFYNGGRFHRATRPDNYKPTPPDRPAMEIIQGGINPEMRGKGFPPIPLERTSVTGIKHVRGVVSMARGTAADTATSDFFILLDDQPSLDFGGKRFDDGQGGAAFGRVVSGMDVVREIQQQPVQAQALTPPVPIVSARRQ